MSSDPFNSAPVATSNTVLPLPAGYQRPSEYWLKSPAYIDGAVNPPVFYHTKAQMDIALRLAGKDPETVYRLQAAALEAARLTPTPLLSLGLNTPMTPSMLESASAHYRPDTIHSTIVPPVLHDVHVNIAFMNDVPGPGTGRGRLSGLPKKTKTKCVKMGCLALASITRAQFIEGFLGFHSLADKFAPGVRSGPNFKLSWTGSSGGKAGAATIQTDDEFGIALAAILAKRGKVQVSVDIDLDAIQAFRIQQMIPAQILNETSVTDGDEAELAYGTRVPHVEGFSELSQLHGRFILELKKQWPCQQHHGEHGEAGCCYITPQGEHMMLNAKRFKEWAAAMAAGDTTKHEPPNTLSFDGARDGRLPVPKARGRGTHARPAPSTSVDPQSIMSMWSLFAPIVANNVRKRGQSDSDSGTPRRPLSKRAKAAIQQSPPQLSPLPEKGHELHQCLSDFRDAHNLDLSIYEAVLAEHDFTPHIIPLVDVPTICKLLELSHGNALQLKDFCKEWSARLSMKLLASRG